MRIKRFAWIGIMFLSFLLALCGCHGKETTQDSQESVTVMDDWIPIQVLEHEWVDFGKAKEAAEPWHPVDYHEGYCQVPGQDWIQSQDFYAWSGDYLYILSTFSDAEGFETHLQLSRIDIVSMEETKASLDFANMKLSADMEGTSEDKDELMKTLRQGYVTSMDALDDRVYLFLAVRNEGGSLLHHYFIEMGNDGEIYNIMDFASQLYGEERGEQWNLPRGFVSKDDDICFIDEATKKLELFSKDGVSKAKVDLQSFSGDVFVSMIGRANDGTPVFQAIDWKGRISYFTPDAITFEGRSEHTLSCLDDEGGMLLWLDSSLVRWNVETGEASRLCALKGLETSFCKGIRKNSQGQIVLAYDEGDGICFYRYAVGEGNVKATLRIASFFADGYVEDCAADYERTHPGTLVEFTEYENPFQNSMSLNRLAEECKGDKGADLILFSGKEQLETLQGAGSLAGLDGILSPETMKGLFGCARELGKVGDALYGIPCEISLKCMIASKADWGKETWTAQEVMECYEDRKAREEGLERFMAFSYPADSQQLLFDLCMVNLDDTPFIDFEKGSCDFNSMEFKTLLRFCKENAELQSFEYLNGDELASQIRSGKAFEYPFEGELASYSGVRAKLGKEYSSVGMPSENGQGFIALSYKYVTMNAFSKNRELAADFLEYLLSEKCQVKYGRGKWVRRDVIESHVRERVTTVIYKTPDSEGEEVIECHFQQYGGVMPLAVDENGDSFVKEYLDIMDKARPYSTHSEVRAIISEEADAYFAGAKTVDEVADIIQNRVQLYLKER